MGYISEDYCSEELSGMLMEKGYIGATNTYLGKDDINVKQITIQSAMKWLREMYNWHIEISRGPKGYHIWIVTIPLGVARYITEEVCGKGIKYLDTYESACETAIKYCLENLI